MNKIIKVTIKLILLTFFLVSLSYTAFPDSCCDNKEKEKPKIKEEIKTKETKTLSSCGPLALTLALNHFGIPADDSEVAKLTKIDKDGNTTMYNLKITAEKKGLKAVGMRLTYKELKEEISKDKLAIAYVNDSHFALVRKITDNEVFIATCNPDSFQKLSKEDFSKIWKGCALILPK